LDLIELWRYRELLFILAWRDVQVRYKQTVLGAAWAVLQPALFMGVFILALGRLNGTHPSSVPYPLFVYAGLLPWSFFATIVLHAANSVVDSERLITKVYFPRLAIPFAAAGVATLDFLIAGVLLVGLLVYYHVGPTWRLAAVPIVVTLLLMGALGAGSLLAALNVAYRDFRHVLPFLIQITMFATPAIYLQQAGAGPLGSGRLAGARAIMDRSPLTILIASFRSAVLGSRGDPMAWGDLAWSAGGIVVFFVAGCACFRRVEDSFADII
jgi:lipopolysaccharide transport system permease protein